MIVIYSIYHNILQYQRIQVTFCTIQKNTNSLPYFAIKSFALAHTTRYHGTLLSEHEV